jgi:hypothetical protein
MLEADIKTHVKKKKGRSLQKAKQASTGGVSAEAAIGG